MTLHGKAPAADFRAPHAGHSTQTIALTLEY
jgi:hypothetical protein